MYWGVQIGVNNPIIGLTTILSGDRSFCFPIKKKRFAVHIFLTFKCRLTSKRYGRTFTIEYLCFCYSSCSLGTYPSLLHLPKRHGGDFFE